jgi:hypothetical protein
MSNKFAIFCSRLSVGEKWAAWFFKIARARARADGSAGFARPKSRPPRSDCAILHIQHNVYTWHILVHSVPVHAQAARRAFRPWSATGRAVAARHALKLLLGSIARQCGPIVSGCTAPTCEMSPVNGAIGLVNSPVRCNPPPLDISEEF